jgi:hypothetical protein
MGKLRQKRLDKLIEDSYWTGFFDALGGEENDSNKTGYLVRTLAERATTNLF